MPGRGLRCRCFHHAVYSVAHPGAEVWGVHPGPTGPTPTQLPVLGVSGPAVSTQGQACLPATLSQAWWPRDGLLLCADSLPEVCADIHRPPCVPLPTTQHSCPAVASLVPPQVGNLFTLEAESFPGACPCYPPLWAYTLWGQAGWQGLCSSRGPEDAWSSQIAAVRRLERTDQLSTSPAQPWRVKAAIVLQGSSAGHFRCLPPQATS